MNLLSEQRKKKKSLTDMS